MIRFAGIVDNSTIDYPGKVAAVVYLCGCPYRCPWCQNPELVAGTETCKTADVSDILDLLEHNFLIEAVCVTGGEPLMQDATIDLLRRLREETSLLLKVDTNGYYPENLEKALPHLDLLTMDVKAPLDERYGKAVGLPDRWDEIVTKAKKSLEILRGWKKEKEARTTIVPGLVDKVDDIEAIAEAVEKAGFTQYTLQQFRSEKTFDPEYSEKKSPSPEFMRKLGETAKKLLPRTKVVVVTQQSGFFEIK